MRKRSTPIKRRRNSSTTMSPNPKNSRSSLGCDLLSGLRVVVLVSVVFTIAGFLLYPDIVRAVDVMREKPNDQSEISGDSLSTSSEQEVSQCDEESCDSSGRSHSQYQANQDLESKHYEKRFTDSGESSSRQLKSREQNSGKDVKERSRDTTLTEDLMEDELEEMNAAHEHQNNNKDKHDKAFVHKDIQVENGNTNVKRSKKASSKTSAKSSSSQKVPTRPGKKPGDPPPIILNGENNEFVIDPSQMKIVHGTRDKDNEPKEKIVSNAGESGKSKKKKHRDKAFTKGNQGGRNVSENDEKSEETKSSQKPKDSTKDIKESEQSRIKTRAKSSTSQNKLVNEGKTKNTQQVKDAQPPTPPRRPGKSSKGPIILNADNDKIVIDPSQIKMENSPPPKEPDRTKREKIAKHKVDNKGTNPSKHKQTKTTKSESGEKTKQDQGSKKNKLPSTSKTTKGNQDIDETNKHSKSDKKPNAFKVNYQRTFTPKKVFVDGRRIPPVELLAQKETDSSIKVFLFDEFLSDKECDGLIQAHESHKASWNQQPILCFDSVNTLQKYIKDAKKKTKVTENDFTQGTRCLNNTFSAQVQNWLHSNWSYSTAFYPEESKFSKVAAARIEQAMGLSPQNGGKFQITSYPVGKAYKAHTDCTVGADDKRDRVASVLMYLNDAEDGGETEFPELGIWVKPRKGRALVWNNMSPTGVCEPHSKHVAKVVNKGQKYILIRWYYYKSFRALGSRPQSPALPPRESLQAMVMCDDYETGSCRWYDEWSHDVLVDYRSVKESLQ